MLTKRRWWISFIHMANHKAYCIFTRLILHKTAFNNWVSCAMWVVWAEKLIISIVTFIIIWRFSQRLEWLSYCWTMIGSHAGFILAKFLTENFFLRAETGLRNYRHSWYYEVQFSLHGNFTIWGSIWNSICLDNFFVQIISELFFCLL